MILIKIENAKDRIGQPGKFTWHISPEEEAYNVIYSMDLNATRLAPGVFRVEHQSGWSPAAIPYAVELT